MKTNVLQFAVAAVALLLLLAAPICAQLPPCPVGAAVMTRPNPVTAGRVAHIKLAVKAIERGSGQNLSVAINLPSNCCLVKGRAWPSLKNTPTPTPKVPLVVGQNAIWLNVPFTDKTTSRRLFLLSVRVSLLYTSAVTVPITAMVYATNTTGEATCATIARPASVSSQEEGNYEVVGTVGRARVNPPWTTR